VDSVDGLTRRGHVADRRLEPGLNDHSAYRRYPYRLGGDVLPRDMGGRGVPPGYRSEPGPHAQGFGLFRFNITYAVTSVQAIAAGLLGLADKSARPVFPRWVSSWAIFTGLSFVPLTAMPFFKTVRWRGMAPFRFGHCSESISFGPPPWEFVWRGTQAGNCVRRVPLKRRASGSSVALALPPDAPAPMVLSLSEYSFLEK
jgi:hypothetical protein